MFSFRSLFEKVSQVQTDLSDKLHTSSGTSTPDLSITADDKHDITAGSELLNRYQGTWEDIHKTSMDQAKAAAQAADLVNNIHSKIKYQDLLMTQLVTCITELPNLADVIDNCTNVVRETGLNISTLQVELGKLEQECDKLQIERMKSVHQHHLNAYRDDRQKELNSRKNEMEKAYNESIKFRLNQESIVMKERHAIFGAEFQKDMQEFKNKRIISPVLRDMHVNPLETLESFVPEEDPELSKFLDSCDASISKFKNKERKETCKESQNTPLNEQNLPVEPDPTQISPPQELSDNSERDGDPVSRDRDSLKSVEYNESVPLNSDQNIVLSPQRTDLDEATNLVESLNVETVDTFQVANSDLDTAEISSSTCDDGKEAETDENTAVIEPQDDNNNNNEL